MKIKIKIKKITQIKLSLFVLVLIISALVFNALSYRQHEVKFNNETAVLSGRTIETKDGRQLILADDINPFIKTDYIGYVKNDTIISYRRELTKLNEFIYMFGTHDPYKLYVCDEKENARHKEFEPYKVETMNMETVNFYLKSWFILFLISASIYYVVSTMISLYFEENEKYFLLPGMKIIYTTLRFILMMLIVFYLMNYAFWLVFVFVAIMIIEGVFFFDDILSIMTKHGYYKYYQKDKKDKLYKNFLSLIEPKKEKKKKVEKIIHF